MTTFKIIVLVIYHVCSLLR